MNRAVVWRWWLVAGLVAIVTYFLVPNGSVASNAMYDGIGLISALAILYGVRLHRPARPAMWYWLAAGQILSVLGDLVYEYYDLVLHEQPYPSPADIFYLGSYPVIATGLLLLVRRRRGNGTAGLIDAAIAATGLGLAFWVFVLQPVADASASSALERWIGTAYPAADVLLLAMVARLFADSGARSASTRLIGVAAVLVLAADTAFSLVSLYWSADLPVINAGFLVAYLCWAAAALHPSMAAAEAERQRTVRPLRPALLGLCALVAPTLLFLPWVGASATDRKAVALASIVLFLLVIGRVTGVMRWAQRLAMTDDLTGLANRRRLEQELRRSGPAEVAMLGLNGFKSVNDELGRPVGDRVLGALAARLLSAVPPGALVARLGGDEFAVLMPAGSDAGDLARALRPTIRVDGRDLLIGVSIGLADVAGLLPEEILRRAEAAMYAAKASGEPVRRWAAAMDDHSIAFTRLGAELRTALDEDRFRVVYQPIVALPSGRIEAVEALVRWEDPVRGVVSPAEFIPVTEQNGLIVELGEWILRTALAKFATWRTSLGPDAPDRISVNASAKQLARPGFAATVAEALASRGLPASCLVIEVTETAVFGGGQAVAALHELRALGVRIALDDFGTGHSSLGLLQTVPVDTIKVDKSFIDKITYAGRHAVIAESLFRISAGLGLTAVAEGVETAEQAAALSAIGYRYLQGYFYGRPVPEPEFALVVA